MKNYTEEEQAFIDGVEFAIDYRLEVSREDIEKYFTLVNNK